MAKTLGELASEYAQKEFPVYPEKDDIRNIGKHDVAFHAFADGWNAAKRQVFWVAADEDLPCNHDELIGYASYNKRETKPVLVVRIDGEYSVESMYKDEDDVWRWSTDGPITYWARLPELPED